MPDSKRGRMWQSFKPATQYDSPLAADILGDKVRLMVGGNKTMIAAIDADTALELIHFLGRAVSRIQHGPVVTKVPIQAAPPPPKFVERGPVHSQRREVSIEEQAWLATKGDGVG